MCLIMQVKVSAKILYVSAAYNIPRYWYIIWYQQDIHKIERLFTVSTIKIADTIIKRVLKLEKIGKNKKNCINSNSHTLEYMCVWLCTWTGWARWCWRTCSRCSRSRAGSPPPPTGRECPPHCPARGSRATGIGGQLLPIGTTRSHKYRAKARWLNAYV